MNRPVRITVSLITLTALITANFVSLQPVARAQAETPQVLLQENAPQDVPDALVASGATKIAFKSPKVFWYTGVPLCPPPLSGGQPQQPYHELIQRIATYGSPVRALYDELVDCGANEVKSNLIADDDFLYWLDATGLMMLSTDANPGDPPMIMNALVDLPGEIADGGDRIYSIDNNTGGANTHISYVTKDNHQKVYVNTPGGYASNLQARGIYVYYIVGGNLIRQEPGVDMGVTIATGVTGYYPEGMRLAYCSPWPYCYFSDNVYIAQGTTIRIYNNQDDTLSDPIYTSLDPTAAGYSLVADNNDLFFFESRQTTCEPFCLYISVLVRLPRGGGAGEIIYTYNTPVMQGLPANLNTDNTYLYWHDDDQVLRLPNNASELPMVNLYVTGMEVTQGIQNTSNTVLLIQGKRTFVRVFVKSAGSSVSGVGAQLVNTADPEAFALAPVNPAGTKLTVHANPNKDDIDQSFLFELPWSWVEADALHLRAELNPYKIPLEPNYSDNQTTADLTLSPSPDLPAEFFRMNYVINNTTYSPRIWEDVVATYSWILRAYPIGGAVGEHFKPGLWDVDGNVLLGMMVDQSFPICAWVYSDPSLRNLCASYFSNGWLWDYRIMTMFGWLNIGLRQDAFYYGMITDAAGFFPRGQAQYVATSSGPVGTPGSGSWDTDGTYGDWYAAHEIGHSLGRAHPNSGSATCGHSASDPGYPYADTTNAPTPIGPPDGSMEGFDVGDDAFSIPVAVYPSSTWNDVMSYCSNQWISDYTYTAMYNAMMAASQRTLAPQAPIPGDFLAVSGAINPVAEKAGFSSIRRLNEVSFIPPITPGAYSLRLLDEANAELADYPFTPEPVEATSILNFAQVVDFVSGTRTVQVVRLSDEAVLVSQPVSANPPVVTNVALVGAPDPVTGIVTLQWDASDPDGDTLTFEILYSRDNGTVFQPVAEGVTGNSLQIDTAALGGSDTAVLRVVASDGLNAGFADSAPFVMAPKLPTPFILTPEDGLHIHYGQLVNFNGTALDAQDGVITGGGLTWWNEDGAVIGTGSLLSVDDLPVGENVITLRAVNSASRTDTTSVTIFVDDDLNLPGPTLTAGPSPVGWHVPAGSTALKMATVSLNNAGSGSLNWTASVDAAWLGVSPISGTIDAGADPSNLLVIANPSGLAANKSYSGTITLTKPATANDPEQIIIIHVSLAIGNIRNMGATSPKIFLPVIVR